MTMRTVCGECRYSQKGWCNKLECPVEPLDNACKVYEDR